MVLGMLTSKKAVGGLSLVVALLLIHWLIFGGGEGKVGSHAEIEKQLLERFQYEGALAKLQGTARAMAEPLLLVSVIVPCYNQVDTLRRTLDSISLQADFPYFEIIVVNDGSPDPSIFYTFADEYAAEKPKGVRKVDITRLGKVPKKPAKPQLQAAYFVSKPNGGLGSARNFGIELASGKWIMALDSDDVLAPNFFEAVMTELAYHGFDLYDSGPYNLISTDMGGLDGKALSWQPLDVSKVDIRQSNAFHCSAMFLRSVYAEEKLRFRPVLAWGWEDWDYWIRVHDKVGVNALYVRKPVFLYSSAGGGRDSKAHMASFCSEHQPYCKAVITLANARLYDDSTLRDHVRVLMGKAGGYRDNSVQVGASKNTQWTHAMKETLRDPPEPTALLLQGLSRQLNNDLTGATVIYRQIMDMGCEADGVDRAAYHLLSLLKVDKTYFRRPATMCSTVLSSRILRNDPTFDMTKCTFVR